jgi:hypothetical protein
MTGDLKSKQKLPDHVIAPEGTSVFRAVNFERYVVKFYCPSASSGRLGC